MYLTTRDFKIKNISTDTYLTDEAVEKIFPPNKFTKSYLLFSRLRPKISNDIPGETLHFTARFKEGIAKENGHIMLLVFPLMLILQTKVDRQMSGI